MFEPTPWEGDVQLEGCGSDREACSTPLMAAPFLSPSLAYTANTPAGKRSDGDGGPSGGGARGDIGTKPYFARALGRPMRKNVTNNKPTSSTAQQPPPVYKAALNVDRRVPREAGSLAVARVTDAKGAKGANAESHSMVVGTAIKRRASADGTYSAQSLHDHQKVGDDDDGAMLSGQHVEEAMGESTGKVFQILTIMFTVVSSREKPPRNASCYHVTPPLRHPTTTSPRQPSRHDVTTPSCHHSVLS